MSQKDTFVVHGLGGAKNLSGSVQIGGAKNAALPALAASLLFGGPVTYRRIPELVDTRRMRNLIEGMGAQIDGGAGTYTIDGGRIDTPTIDSNIGEHMRASIIATGPALARFGEVIFPHPGGCVIGERPIDLFLEGFAAMGANIRRGEDGTYHLTASEGLSGAEFFFRVQSHTATETLMMAAVLAEGTTVLKNASVEPEITHLADFLNACGAEIYGAGTHTITVSGTGLLQADQPYVTMPDRLETGSFLVLGALCAHDLEITDCNPEHVEIVWRALDRAGVPLVVEDDVIRIADNTVPNKTFSVFDITTHEYPGYPTDLQAPSVVFLTQAGGEARVFETIFEGRLFYTDDLNAMGADITMFDPHRIAVRGPTPLSGRRLEGPDIRAGLAFVIAALVANGESVIENVYYIDRGYERIERRLQALGAEVARVSE